LGSIIARAAPPEFDFQVDRFARVHAGRCHAVEMQIDLERAVGDLRIDFGDLRFVVAIVDREERVLPQHDAPEIEFIDLRRQLEAVEGIDFAQYRALRLGLADFGVERRQLPVHRRADRERVDGCIGDRDAAFHANRWIGLRP
jgi:hypothetical protein